MISTTKVGTPHDQWHVNLFLSDGGNELQSDPEEARDLPPAALRGAVYALAFEIGLGLICAGVWMLIRRLA